MAASFLNNRARTGAAVVLVTAAFGATANAAEVVRPGEAFAGAATARDFRTENSRWLFQKSVHILTGEAELQSNTASAAIVGGQIAQARVEGSPAQFEQRGGRADRQVRGRAGVIEYDFVAGVVKLTDQVWFSNGKDEFRGDVVIYNVRDERVQINPGGQSSGRVHGIIRPQQRSEKVAPEKPAQPESGE